MPTPGASCGSPQMVEAAYQRYDHALRQRLKSASHADEDFWSFRENAARRHGHGFFQYPAMTVPQLQRHLLEAVRESSPRICRVYDPFVGSGTTMTEAVLQGMEFVGRDINPLAVLVCHAKMQSLEASDLPERSSAVIGRALTDTCSAWDVDFPGRAKWFKEEVGVELSRLRRAILKEDDQVVRRFLWVALAETVRLTSNSRTSTFKLHIRPQAEIATRNLRPIEVFKEVVGRNQSSLAEFRRLLRDRRLLRKGTYRGSVNVSLANAGTPFTKPARSHGYDLLITSPPYGDNTSTVPYGQHSYLPLQWIETTDLDSSFDLSYLKTTLEIDRRSLGGSLRGAISEVGDLRSQSPALDRTLRNLSTFPRDRMIRVAAFYRDLAVTLKSILGALRRNAYMVWTVGNRKVGGAPVPMDEILIDLLTGYGAIHVTSVARTIPVKRMATKNSVSTTMRSETILVLRKAK